VLVYSENTDLTKNSTQKNTRSFVRIEANQSACQSWKWWTLIIFIFIFIFISIYFPFSLFLELGLGLEW